MLFYVIIILLSIVWIGFFLWTRTDYKRQKKDSVRKKSKPSFRSEENLEGYDKPLEDYQPPEIDFDDAE